MNNDQITTKRFLLYETTLGEFLSLGNQNQDSSQGFFPYESTLVKYERTRPLTEEEKEQTKTAYQHGKYTAYFSARTSTLEELIKEAVVDVATSVGDEDVESKVREKVQTLPIYMLAIFRTDSKNIGNYHTECFVGEKNEDCIDNTEELVKMMNKIKTRTYNNGMVPLVSLEVCYAKHDVSYARGHIERLIKKHIREKLVYCLKNGKVIVPKEYLDKGEAGIREWQEKKRNSNKNNSMEKRLIRATLKEKKNKIYCFSFGVECRIGSHLDWGVPRITIEGLFNKGFHKKLITSNLLKDKADQDIIGMTDEQSLAMVKEYWKNELEEAKKRIEELTLDDSPRYTTSKIF